MSMLQLKVVASFNLIINYKIMCIYLTLEQFFPYKCRVYPKIIFVLGTLKRLNNSTIMALDFYSNWKTVFSNLK